MKVAIGLGIAGIVIILPGVMWFSSPRLSNDDLNLAFQPLLSIPLARLEHERSVSADVTIPDSPQWRQIRLLWGEPPYLLAVVEQDRELVYCTDELGLELKIIKGSGRVIPEKPVSPYGFSVWCHGNIGYQFRASSGAKLTVHIDAANLKPLPAGNVVLINNWYNAKDKIVGVMLNADFRKIFFVTSLIGGVLISSAAYLIFRGRQH